MPSTERAIRYAWYAALITALSACQRGGGAQQLAGAAPATPPAMRTASAQLSFVLPKAAASRLRVPTFLPSAAKTAIVSTSAGGSPQSFTVGSGSSNCTATGSGYACTLGLSLPVGSQTLTVALNDGSSNLLASGSAAQTIVADQLNVLVPMQLLGAVSNATLSAAATTVGYNIPTTISLASASDAAGDAITGTFAQPLVLGSSGNTVTFATSQFTAVGAPASISATLSSTSVPLFGTATVTVTPVGGSVAGTLTLTRGAAVTTFAGSTSGCVDGTGTAAQFSQSSSIVIDGAGNLIVADQGCKKLRKITSAGVVSTFAGTGAPTTAGNPTADDSASSLSANVWPVDEAIDTNGDVYFTDVRHTVRVAFAAGGVQTIAGTGNQGFNDNCAGASAQFAQPIGIAIDAANRKLYVADSVNNRIRMIDLTSGNNYYTTTLAGNGTNGEYDSVTGSSAQFSAPYDMARDTAGNLYVNDYNGHTIRKVVTIGGSAGAVSTLAGNSANSGNVDGTGSSAQFNIPYGIGITSSGLLFEHDYPYCTLRTITQAGVVTTVVGVAGTSTGCSDVDGGPATAQVKGVANGQWAVDAAGALYFSENQLIRKLQ